MDIEFNIEGYPTPDFIELVQAAKPDQVTLVPDAPDQRTSDHGWDVDADRDMLADVLGELKRSGARVALFMDPEPAAMAQAAALGADRIELYTEPYAAAFGTSDVSMLCCDAMSRRRRRRRRPVSASMQGMISISTICPIFASPCPSLPR